MPKIKRFDSDLEEDSSFKKRTTNEKRALVVELEFCKICRL